MGVENSFFFLYLEHFVAIFFKFCIGVDIREEWSGKFRQIITDVLPLIDVENLFQCSILSNL